MYKRRPRRIPRNGNHRVLRKYKSGAFSQNTPATSSRTEPSSGIPLGAPNVREKLCGSAAALFQRFGYARVSLRDITSFVDIPNFCARAWSVPTPAHQHFAGGGSGAPSPLVLQIAEGIRHWNTKVAALSSLAQAEGQIAAEEDPDLLASLFINCWQGATIRTKCDPSARCDCLGFVLDRVLGASGGGGRNE